MSQDIIGIFAVYGVAGKARLGDECGKLHRDGLFRQWQTTSNGGSSRPGRLNRQLEDVFYHFFFFFVYVCQHPTISIISSSVTFYSLRSPLYQTAAQHKRRVEMESSQIIGFINTAIPEIKPTVSWLPRSRGCAGPPVLAQARPAQG